MSVFCVWAFSGVSEDSIPVLGCCWDLWSWSHCCMWLKVNIILCTSIIETPPTFRRYSTPTPTTLTLCFSSVKCARWARIYKWPLRSLVSEITSSLHHCENLKIFFRACSLLFWVQSPRPLQLFPRKLPTELLQSWKQVYPAWQHTLNMYML